MEIESKIKREGGTKVLMGKTNYHFAPNTDGAHVATVENEEHQDRFLSITEGYRLYRAGQTPAAATEVLLGSDVHDASYDIGGVTHALGDLVAAAHKDSGLSAQEWNELEGETRAGLIDEQLDKLADAVSAPPASAKTKSGAKK